VIAFVSFAANFLVLLFLVGLAGSLLVIVITFIEDLDLFFPDKEPSDESAVFHKVSNAKD
jgi:hypothetical protein